MDNIYISSVRLLNLRGFKMILLKIFLISALIVGSLHILLLILDIQDPAEIPVKRNKGGL